MLPKEAYEEAHRNFPLLAKYPNKQSDCSHSFNFVVFCNDKVDIVRCRICGYEKETKCIFDEDYNWGGI